MIRSAAATAGTIVVGALASVHAWMTTGQAALRLRLSRQRVHQLIAAGEIPGARRTGTKGTWLIPAEWVRQQMVPVIRRKPEEPK